MSMIMSGMIHVDGHSIGGGLAVKREQGFFFFFFRGGGMKIVP